MTSMHDSSTVLVHVRQHRVFSLPVAFLTFAVLSGCGGGEPASYVTNTRVIPSPLGSVASMPCTQVVDEAGQPVGPPVCSTAPSPVPTPPRQAVEWELRTLPGGPYAIQGSGCQLLRGGEPITDPASNWVGGWYVKVVLRMKVGDAQHLIAMSNGDWKTATESEILPLTPCDQLPDAVPTND